MEMENKNESKTEKNAKWKKKALSLSMAVTMSIVGGSVLSGCELQPYTYQDKVQDQEKEDDTTYHGTGTSPFVFFSSGGSSGVSGTTSNGSKFSTSGWKSWSTPTISSSKGTATAIKGSSGYSSVHATSVSS